MYQGRQKRDKSHPRIVFARPFPINLGESAFRAVICNFPINLRSYGEDEFASVDVIPLIFGVLWYG